MYLKAMENMVYLVGHLDGIQTCGLSEGVMESMKTRKP